jgi:hypothetical protein
VRREFNVLALIKGQERFVFVYDDASHQDLVTLFRQHAADPEVSLTWFDAAVLTDKARQQVEASAAEARSPVSRIARV